MVITQASQACENTSRKDRIIDGEYLLCKLSEFQCKHIASKKCRQFSKIGVYTTYKSAIKSDLKPEA